MITDKDLHEEGAELLSSDRVVLTGTHRGDPSPTPAGRDGEPSPGHRNVLEEFLRYSTAMPATRAQIRNSRSASSWYSASVGSLRKST